MTKQGSSILKLGLLILIKDSWLWLKNSYGLGVHPYKTLKELAQEKDRSQQLLLLFWPGYVLVGGLGLTWLGRRFLAEPGSSWGLGANGVLGLTMIGVVMVGIYLGYWWVKVVSAGRRDRR